jgi:hypothetical protein
MGIAAGPAVTTPASLTDATPLPAGEIPAHWLTPGAMIYTTGVAKFTSTATPGTLTIGYYLAKPAVAVASAVLVVASAALVPLASQTNSTFHLHWEIQCLSVGAGGAGVGQVAGSGRVMGLVSLTQTDLIPKTAPFAAVSLDTTSNQRILIGLTPSVTTGSVTIMSLASRLETT